MKRLGGVFVAGCLAATLVQGPATASSRDLPSRKQAAKICRSFFAEDRCENLAGQWRLTLAAGDQAAAERFVDALAADARKDAGPGEECRRVFAEGICAYIEYLISYAMWPVTDPVGYVNAWRSYALQFVDSAYALVRCILDPSCTPPQPL